MLPRSSSASGMLCLRCQSRLLFVCRPHRPAPFAVSAAPFHTNSSLRRRDDDNIQTGNDNWHLDFEPFPPAPETRHTRHQPAQPPKPEKQPQPQTPLPRFQQRHRNRSNTELWGEKSAKKEANAIWDSLLQESAEPTVDEVTAYLDELQPSTESAVPETTFQRLAQEIGESFTATQLLHYLEKRQQPLPQPTLHPWEVERRAWVSDSSVMADAAAGETLTGRHKKLAANPMLRSYIANTMTTKQLLVVQIMRQCWHLSIQERLESTGRLEIHVRDVEFALLLSGAQSWLRSLSQLYSGTNHTTNHNHNHNHNHTHNQARAVHIELLPSQKLLRIRAPSAIADAILADVHRHLERAATRSLRLDEVVHPDSRKKVNAATLQVLSSMTNSWIRLGTEVEGTEGGEKEETEKEGTEKGKKGKKATKTSKASKSKAEPSEKLFVSWLRPEHRDRALEDTRDIVYRLLLHTFGKPPLENTQLVHDDIPKTDAFLLEEVDDASMDKWLWEDRMHRWARLIVPAVLEGEAETERAKETETKTPAFAPPMDWPEPDTAFPAVLPWGNSRLLTVATFGRILHSCSSREDYINLLEPAGDVRVTLPIRQRRILSPVVPPLLGISHLHTDQQAATTSLLLRFLPAPGTPLSDYAPALQLRIEENFEMNEEDNDESEENDGNDENDGGLLVKSLRAVVATGTTDALFPSQPVDVRVTQQRYFELDLGNVPVSSVSSLSSSSSSSSEQLPPPLVNFLRQSQLRLEDGALATPARLYALPLPSYMLRPGSRTRKDTVTVDYVFSGLEVHQRVATSLQGWTLALTNVEAGRGGGHRTELTLEADGKTAEELEQAGTEGVVGAEEAAGSETTEAETTETDAETDEATVRPATFRQAIDHVVHGDTIKWQLRGDDINS